MRRLAPILILLLVLLAVGAVGFQLLTGKPWIECLYLAVITLTTVGYREPEPLDDAGMLFIVVYLIGGASTFMFAIAQLGRWLVSNELKQALENRRMKHSLSNFNDHFIICGCGKMGETICQQLAAQKRHFVVVDNNTERVETLIKPAGWTFVLGDATDDEVLRQAGIDRARGLAAVLSSDAANLYVVLSTRMLNPEIQIVARAVEESGTRKLQRAGARHVISPYHAGAVRMARLMVHPEIDNLLEVADGNHEDLELAEIPLPETSPLVGQTIGNSGLRDRQILVIAIRHADGTRQMPVAGDDSLAAGDSLLVVGQQEALQRLLDTPST